MTCTEVAKCLPLIICTGEGAKIYVGTSAYAPTHVRLKVLATGRLTQYELDVDGDGYYFEPDGEVIPMHAYHVTVLHDGVWVPFEPYQALGYSLVPVTNSYMAAQMQFDYVGEVEAIDQFLTIA